MSNQIISANLFEGNTVRHILIDNEPWFVAKDICEVLGNKNPRQAISRLPDDYRGVHIVDTLGGSQDLNIINEPGLYMLICSKRSKNPLIEKFQRWVFEEVIPSIRKTGQYAFNQRPEFTELEMKHKDLEFRKQDLEYHKQVMNMFPEDHLLKSTIKDHIINNVYSNHQSIEGPKVMIRDLSAILVDMDLKPHEYSLRTMGKFVVKKYREQFNKEPIKTEKACQGSYRPVNAYEGQEIEDVKKWILEYLNQ